MKEVTVTVKGIDRLIKNMNRLQNQIMADCGTGLEKALEDFRDASISHLTGLKWPPSVTQKPIRDKNSWEISRVSMTRYDAISKLTLLSEHGAAVEFGTNKSPKLKGGYFYANDLTQNGRGFPVGKSQGMFMGMKPRIRPQQPKAFIRNSLSNPRVHKSMVDRIASQVRLSIAKWTF